MLYICATPIGNLNDISLRALEILAQADVIVCEDTRTSSKLLSHHGIRYQRLVALHEHNENEVSHKIIEWLEAGQTVVQISDAGTPGISDPGARLCKLAYQHGFSPRPIPGACAFISLLAVAGLSNCPCLFYGFLAAKSSQRQKQLAAWREVDYAIAIYEAPHRILACIQDIINVLGANREIVLGRELTKQFETIKKGSASQIQSWMIADSNQQRGEFVLILQPAEPPTNHTPQLSSQQINTLMLLAQELPAKKAVKLTHQLVGGDKELLYNYLLEHKDD